MPFAKWIYASKRRRALRQREASKRQRRKGSYRRRLLGFTEQLEARQLLAADISTDLQFSTDGDAFSDDLSILQGDEVWVRINYDNTGDAAATNAQAGLTLPAGVTLVPSSTRTGLTPSEDEFVGNMDAGQSGVIDEASVWAGGSLTISPQAGLYTQAVDATSGLVDIGKYRYLNLHSGHYFDGINERFFVSADSNIVGTNVSNSIDPLGVAASTAGGLLLAGVELKPVDLLGQRYVNYHECHYNFLNDHIYRDADGTATTASNQEVSFFNCAGTAGAHILHPDSNHQNFDLSGNRYLNLQQGLYSNGSDTISINIAAGVSTASNTPDTSALAPASFSGYTLQDSSFIALDTLDTSRGSGFVEFKVDTTGASGDLDFTATISDLSGSSEFSNQADTGTLSITPGPDSFHVTTAVDENDGSADPGTGAGTSLREAIIAANASPSVTTITFDASLNGTPILLTLVGEHEDVAATGDLDISSSVIIQGNGVSNTVIDGGADVNDIIASPGMSDRLLHVLGSGELTLDGVTLTGGNEHASLPGGGGAMMVQGSVNISNTSISGNHTTESGGGLYARDLASEVAIVNSIISGNKAISLGGGIGSEGSTQIVNTTISSNSANIGGGIFAQSSLLSVTNSTVTGNTADNGGGFYSVAVGVINNTIFAGNTNGDVLGTGTFSGSNNVVQDGSVPAGLVGTIVADPLLGPLQDNGGPMFTHALGAGSPAINAGDNYQALDPENNMLMTDQRGSGFPRVVDGTVDIGAFEAAIPSTIMVTTITDENDGTVNPNVGDGTSLREAILAANSNPDVTTITFDPSTNYIPGTTQPLRLTIEGSDEDAAATGDLDITSPVHIVGNGRDHSALFGNGFTFENRDRLFHVLSGGDLQITGLQIASGFTDGQKGVAVYVEDGSLTLTDSSIENHTAGNGDGAGIFLDNNTQGTILRSRIIGNSAGGSSRDGGGIFVDNDVTLEIVDSEISHNYASDEGAGIKINNGAEVIIRGSTLANNQATGDGGGIYLNSNANLRIENVTISGNVSQERGGGIMAPYNGGSLEIVNSTITGNMANPDDSGYGGIHIRSGGTAPAPVLSNTIVSGNTRFTSGPYGGYYPGAPSEIGPSTVSLSSGSNLISDPSTAGGLIHGTNGNIVGQDDGASGRQLLPADQVLETRLQDNVGPTPTHYLVAGSPALDAGDNLLAIDELGSTLLNDQRGLSRIQSGTVDIGAVEIQPADSITVTIPGDEVDGDTSPGDISLREAILFANTIPSLTTITFAPELNGSPLTLTIESSMPYDRDANVSDLDVKFSTSIVGNGADQTLIQAGALADRSDSVGRIFAFRRGSSSISGVHLSNGSSEYGGAIRTESNLTIQDSVLTNNSGTYSGGAISAFGRDPFNLTITGSSLTENVAANGRGGAVSAFAIHTEVHNSTIADNTAQTGGGIYTDGDRSRDTLLVFDSTISGNTATSGTGGGIYIYSDHAEVVNSTISGNSASSYGGGIFVDAGSSPPKTLILSSSTIVLNTSGSGGAGVHNNQELVTLSNTLVAGNTASGSPSDLGGDAVDPASSHNLIGAAVSAGGLSDGGPGGNIVGVSGAGTRPVASIIETTLANNGGSTLTHALATGSAANSAGDASLLPADVNDSDGDLDISEAIPFDQRGTGFSRVAGFGLDIGAVEGLDPPTLDVNAGMTLAATATRTLTMDFLSASSAVDPDSDLDFNITVAPTNAHLALATSPETPITTFTQQNLDDDEVVLVQNGTLGADSFEFNVSDSSGSIGPFTFDITVTQALVEFAALSSVQMENVAADGPNLAVLGDLTGTTDLARTVVFTAPGGTATLGVDYNLSNMFVIPEGDYSTPTNFDLAALPSGTPMLSVIDDGIVEPNETISFSFLAFGQATILGNANGGFLVVSAAHTIDSEDQAILTITADSNSVIEGDVSPGDDQTTTYTVSIDTPVQAGFSVALDSLTGTDAEVTDYTLSTASIAFGALDTADKTFTLTTHGDLIVEDNETVQITLGAATPGFDGDIVTGDSDSTVIENDDTATLSLSAPTGPFTESDVDQDISFTVTLDAAVEGGFDVAAALSSGTAEVTDVTLGSPVSFVGDVNETQTLTVTIVGDDIVEDNETFTITLGDVTNTSVEQDDSITTGASAGGTIDNDDTATLSISIPEITEDNVDQTVNATVTLDAEVEGGLDVAYALTLGSAESTDVSVGTGPLSFVGTVGETQNLAITIVGDTIVEDNETFTITLGDVTGTSVEQDADITTGASAEGTIDNDDTATLSISIPEITEDNVDQTVNATVTLDAEVEGGLDVAYALTLGSAESTDVSVGTGPLSFVGTVGETQNLAITIVGDTIVEDNETFTITLGDVTGTSVEQDADITTGASAEGTIDNDDSATLSITIPEITEDNVDQTVNATVTLDAEVEGGLDVAYALTLGSAESTDVSVGTGPLSFVGTVGEAQNLAITIVGDTIVEDNETFTITLGDVTGTSVEQDADITTGASAEGTIDNDDSATLSISIPEITEDDVDQTVNATVTLDAEVEGGVDVAYALTLGSAESTDVSVGTGPLSFVGTVGETQNLAITIVGDTIVEDNETFTITLGDVTGTSSEQDADITTGASAEGTIDNDDSATLSITIPEITEDNVDQTVNATVTLDAEVEGGLDVAYALTLGTAESTDVSVGTGPLSFVGTVGETQNLAITIVGDTIVEDNETFTITLGDVTGTSVEQDADITTGASAEGTIDNDDSATLSITIPEITEDNVDQTVNATVTLDAEVEGGVDVAYALTLGSAESTDVSVGTGPLSFVGTVGETQSLAITIVGDTIVEDNETFTITLGDVTGTSVEQDADITTGASAEGTIDNDDSATLSITIPEITEDDVDQTVNATVTLDAEVEGGFELDMGLTLGTASATDVSVGSAPMVFVGNAGESQTIAITVVGDELLEGSETFSLNVVNVADTSTEQGDNIDASGVANGTIVDDETANAVLSVSSDGDETGPQAIVYEVTLDKQNDGPGNLTFDVAFTGGTALGVDGGTALTTQDYDGSVAGAGVLLVPAGSNVGTLTVPVVDDSLVEATLFNPVETVEATASNPSYPLVAVTTAVATANITDNDTSEVSACIASESGSSDCNPADPDHASEAGVDQGNFVIRLTNPSTTDTFLSYSAGSGDPNEATPGVDYLALSQSVVIPAGEIEAKVTVSVFDDQIVEPTEFVTLTMGSVLFGNPGVSIGSTGQVQMQIIDDDAVILPPTVTGVKVGSTSWQNSFRDAVDPDSPSFGLPIADQAEQLDVLTWVGINQIRIAFSADVGNVTESDIAILGINTPDFASQIDTVIYDDQDFTVTITMLAPFTKDRIRVAVRDTVTDLSGNALDGEWTDGADQYPSGDGSEGGTFNFQLNVLPGDADQSGIVFLNDAQLIDAETFAMPGSPNYNPLYDLDGNGIIFLNDAQLADMRTFDMLPGGSPPIVPDSSGGGGMPMLLLGGGNGAGGIGGPNLGSGPLMSSTAGSSLEGTNGTHGKSSDGGDFDLGQLASDSVAHPAEAFSSIPLLEWVDADEEEEDQLVDDAITDLFGEPELGYEQDF